MTTRHLFETNDATTTDLWDRVLTSQVDFTFGLELSAYYNSPEWHRARTVLDLGTGNGYYLRLLARRFPGKRYLGIDFAPDLIAVAEAKNADEGIAYACRDLFEMSGASDFVILRAVVQHVPDLSRLAARLDALLSEGDAALVIESDDRAPLFFWPEVPAVAGLFADFAREQRAVQSVSGGVVESLIRLVRDRGTFDVVRDTVVAVPTTIDDNLERLRAQFRLIFELLRRTGALAADFTAVEREWGAWCRLEGAYAEQRLRAVCLVKRSRGAAPRS